MKDYTIKSQDAIWKLAVVGVFFLALSYGVRYSFFTPYTGLSLRLNERGDAWIVRTVDGCYNVANCTPVKPGDLVVDVDGLAANVAARTRKPPFEQSEAGEQVSLIIDDRGELRTVLWEIPESSLTHKFGSLSAFFFVLPYLAAASIVVFWVRPFHWPWKILALFFLLYALFVASGMVSTVSDSQVMMRLVSWLLLPLALHVHLLMPTTIMKHRRTPLLFVVYTICFIVAVADVLARLPQRLFYFSFVLQVLIAVMLLMWRIIKNLARGRSLIMLLSFMVAFIPGILWGFVLTSRRPEQIEIIITFASLIALSLWPLVYLYVIGRDQLARFEGKLRESLIFATFIIIFLNVVVFSSSVVDSILTWGVDQMAASWLWLTLLSLLATLSYLGCRWAITSLIYGNIDKRIDHALKLYIQASPGIENIEQLINLISTQIRDALELNQMALYLKDGEKLSRQFQYGIEASSKLEDGRNPDWAVLALPLVVQKETLGIWLLGERKRTNFYSQAHIEKLNVLAQAFAAMIKIQKQNILLEKQLARMIEQEKLAGIARLIASVAHQFNNPLQIIAGALDAYQQYPDDPKAARWFTMATEKVAYLSEVVRSIMRQVRPGRDDLVLVDVNDSIHEALLLSRQRIKDCRADILLNLDPHINQVRLMRTDLTQVIANLVDNACDAMMSVDEAALCVASGQRNGHVYVSVEDTGVGIPEETRNHLFEPFYTSKVDGTGFGLLLVYSIIERAKGRIVVRSEMGKGSKFVVLLPSGEGHDKGVGV